MTASSLQTRPVKIDMSRTTLSTGTEWISDVPYALVALVCGLLFGLSAPGLEQWYIAWFGMVPLLLLALRSAEPSQAAFRGFLFGTGYNLVYLFWANAVRDSVWTCSVSEFPVLLKSITWLGLSAWQGMFVAVFACLIRAIPMSAGWLPSRSSGKLLLPSFMLIPFLWCLVVEKLGNMPALMGVPWSMIEYSQYKQLGLLQCASLIGGTGIAALIVLSNVVLASVANVWKPFRKGNWSIRALNFHGENLRGHSLAAVALITIASLCGAIRLENERHEPPTKTIDVAAVQSPPVAGETSVQTAGKLLTLSANTKGLVVFPEWSFYTNAAEDNFLRIIGALAPERSQRWVLGLLDEIEPGKEFNATAAVDKNGKPSPLVYHKNYLVPFGEFTPVCFLDSIYGMLVFPDGNRIAETPAGRGIKVYDLGDVRAGSMLCFENILPDLSAQNTRAGAEILADCSNTSWFHKSILSDQMVAFCVMRAVENHRPFVFSTTRGPSTIVAPTGEILKQGPREKAAIISANVALYNDITPFTWYCRW